MTSTNVPVLSLLKSCQGAPLSRRPNQCTGLPSRALNPALSALAVTGVTSSTERIDSISGSGCTPE